MTKVKEPCKSCMYYNRDVLGATNRKRFAYCRIKNIQIKNTPKDCDKRKVKYETV